MHILLLSLFYYPEPVARPHDLAVTLCQMGYQVSVVTAYPNYPNGKLYPGYQQHIAERQYVDGVSLIRVPHLVDRSRSAFRRVLSYGSFSLSSLLSSLACIRCPDIIWTYQIGLPGVVLSTLRGVPLVHEVQDLWPDWGHVAGLGGKAWLYHLLEENERAIYNQACSVVTITEGFKSALAQKGVPPEKIVVIPNWASEESFHPEPPSSQLANKEGLAGRFNVMYVGNIGTAQALQVLLDAAELVLDLPEIQFVIIGDGVERDQLEKQAASRRLKNVRFLGSRPQHQVAGYMALADVLFVHLKKNPVYEVTIPSKTYGYLASGKPVLAAAEGELAKLITSHGAGMVCPPENPTVLAETVRTLKRMPQAALDAMGQAGHRAVTGTYSRQSQGQRYADLFEKVVNTYQARRS